MPDARWSDVDADLASAETHFARAGELYDPAEMAGESLEAYKTRMAFMHAMHAGYSSVGHALVRIFAMLDEELPSGPSWHADLLNRAARPIPDNRPAILGRDMKTDLDALRRFRHVADHTYDDFRPKEAVTAAGLFSFRYEPA